MLTASERAIGLLENEEHWDKHELPQEEQAEFEETREVVRKIVEFVVNSRERSVATKSHLRLELADGCQLIQHLIDEFPDSISYGLDEWFTRQILEAVPGYVRRVMALSAFETVRVPSQITAVYVQEAVRTYVLGLPQASVALSRAAVEQALKEGYGIQATKSDASGTLLDEAESAMVIDGTVRKMAERVLREANEVLHERPTDLPTAYDVLVHMRGVLQHVYAGP